METVAIIILVTSVILLAISIFIIYATSQLTVASDDNEASTAYKCGIAASVLGAVTVAGLGYAFYEVFTYNSLSDTILKVIAGVTLVTGILCSSLSFAAMAYIGKSKSYSTTNATYYKWFMGIAIVTLLLVVGTIGYISYRFYSALNMDDEEEVGAYQKVVESGLKQEVVPPVPVVSAKPTLVDEVGSPAHSSANPSQNGKISLGDFF